MAVIDIHNHTTVTPDNIERLKLDPERIVSVHALDQMNDGRLTTVAEIRASNGGLPQRA